jgi:hypothetical protein
MHPTITITLDPIKGPSLSTTLSTEQTYLVLNGMAANMLVKLVQTKEDRRILSAV